MHDAAVDAKEAHHLLGPELVSRWSAYFPPAPAERLFHWLADKDGQNKVLNIPISNVPGPREPGRVGGALVTEIYSVGPLTTGSGLNITVWSYVDQLNVSVLSDGATLLDPHELTDAMIDAFVEIRRAAGLSEQLTVIESAMDDCRLGRRRIGAALGVHPGQELLDRLRRVVRAGRTVVEVERMLCVRDLRIGDGGRRHLAQRFGELAALAAPG